MQKGDKNFKKGDIMFLNQLVNSLNQARESLEAAHGKKDYENFNKSKKFILDIQNKISQIIK